MLPRVLAPWSVDSLGLSAASGLASATESALTKEYALPWAAHTQRRATVEVQGQAISAHTGQF